MAASIRVIAVSAWPSSQSSPRHQRQVGHASILAGRTRRQSVLLAACVERLEARSITSRAPVSMSHEKANHRLPAHRVEQRGSITARFGELKQGRDRFLGQRQLTTNDARGGQPEHDLELLGRVSKALAQFARAGESCHRLVRRWPLGSDQARPQSELEVKFQPVLSLRRRADGPRPRYLVASVRWPQGWRSAWRPSCRPAANMPPPFRTVRPR